MAEARNGMKKMCKVRFCATLSVVMLTRCMSGLKRQRDSLLSQLRDLSKQKPRGKNDDNLFAEVSRLESAITIAKDDLVRHVLLPEGTVSNVRELSRLLASSGSRVLKMSSGTLTRN